MYCPNLFSIRGQAFQGGGQFLFEHGETSIRPRWQSSTLETSKGSAVNSADDFLDEHSGSSWTRRRYFVRATNPRDNIKYYFHGSEASF